MSMEKHFDDKIRQALEKLQTQQGTAGAWEAFEQRLEQDAATSEKSFDDLVSNKLTHLEVPLSQGDWGLMEKMIDADETAEQLEHEAAVDNLVFEKLENFQVAYQPHHWQLMAKRLEDEFFIRYHLIRCKAAEAGLMLLMLLTISRLSPISEGFPEPQTAPTTPLAERHENKKITDNPTTIAFYKAPVKKAEKRTGNHTKALGGPDFQASAGFNTAIAETNQSANSSAFRVGEIAKLATLGLVSPTPHQATQNPIEALAADRLEQGLLAVTLKKPIDQLALPDARPIPSKYAWESLRLPKTIFEKEKQLRFAIFTNTDLAYVITPPNKYSVFDTLVATGPDTTLASGYGGGITVSWKKGKWEMLTGGIYTFKRYIPNTPVFLFETVNYYIREEFNGVQLDILQVPLNFNYHVKDQGKWRFYGSFGASSHFITSSVYEIATSRTPSFSNFARMPMPEGLPADDDSISEERDLPEGLFDGGTIRDNFYLTANVGMGMERYVSPRWSVYFQPNYQHHLLTNGIGMNGEKLYNFSFQLGTKVNLK